MGEPERAGREAQPPHVAGGCRLARDTLGAVEAAGFVVERVRRLRFPPGPLGLPHVLGIARRP